MFDDDDDVEPQVNYVDKYYFEEGPEKPVCFSVLPIKLDEENEVACYDHNEVNLRGFSDNNLHNVYKKVVAWRVELDCQPPKISVLSSEGNWIELLEPRRCYEKTVRSILITLQMLHFVRKWPRKQERRLFEYLCDVFHKFDPSPSEDDIEKHHPLIKLFMERNPILRKSKIIQCFIANASRKAIKPMTWKVGTTEQFIVSDDCGYRDDNNSDDNDNGVAHRDNNTDSDTDGNGTDDGTDHICAICDDGGSLLSCEGQCKRAFHPTVKDGRESKCRTLCYTPAELELKEKGIFLCPNCEYNEHQCFKCGKLEPSYAPNNAKVFRCNKETCGHFYHPKCVAVLLDPGDTDGVRKLEKRIADGMSFTCPAHWCFKCGQMEDRTQRARWLAFCRRCPKSYHIECLPSEISFDTKGKDGPKLGWKISKRSYFYCLHHGIDATIGTPSGDHIKFSSISEIKGAKNLAKENVKVTGKRKNNVKQCSIKSTQLASALHREESKQTGRVAQNSSTELALQHVNVAKRLKADLQIEPPMVEAAASIRNAKSVEGKKQQLGTSSSFVMGKGKISSNSSNVDGETGKRVTSTAEKETSIGISHDLTGKGVTRQPDRIETDGMSECSVQIADKLHWYVQTSDTIVDFCCNMDNFSLLMKEKLEDVHKRCNFKNYDIFQHKNDLCFEEDNWETMQPKDLLPHGSDLIIVLNPPFGIQAVSVNKLVDKVLTLRPRLIIIVAPTEIERLDCKEEPYHLIWEYNQHILGEALYQPGDVDVNGEAENCWHVTPLYFSLWSCPDRAEENRRIAGKHGHLSVRHKTIFANQEHSVLLKNPPVNKGAKWDTGISITGKGITHSEREQKFDYYSGKQQGIFIKDTSHANQEQNDELHILHKEIHDGGRNNLSRDSIACQEREDYQG